MHSRASELIRSLGLAPHPEGGYYAEVYRSESTVQPRDSRSERSALTTIYFLLIGGDVSRWHRVRSDEAWHFYEGDPLELVTTNETFDPIERRQLGPVSPTARPIHVVPAGEWQAARSIGAYTLVGCTVGPGFDFADFELLRDNPAAVEAARRRPDAAQFE